VDTRVPWFSVVAVALQKEPESKFAHRTVAAVPGAVARGRGSAPSLLLTSLPHPAQNSIPPERRAKANYLANSTISGTGKYLSAGMDGFVSKQVRSVLLRAEIDQSAMAGVRQEEKG